MDGGSSAVLDGKERDVIEGYTGEEMKDLRRGIKSNRREIELPSSPTSLYLVSETAVYLKDRVEIEYGQNTGTPSMYLKDNDKEKKRHGNPIKDHVRYNVVVIFLIYSCTFILRTVYHSHMIAGNNR